MVHLIMMIGYEIPLISPFFILHVFALGLIGSISTHLRSYQDGYSYIFRIFKSIGLTQGLNLGTYQPRANILAI